MLLLDHRPRDYAQPRTPARNEKSNGTAPRSPELLARSPEFLAGLKGTRHKELLESFHQVKQEHSRRIGISQNKQHFLVDPLLERPYPCVLML